MDLIWIEWKFVASQEKPELRSDVEHLGPVFVAEEQFQRQISDRNFHPRIQRERDGKKRRGDTRWYFYIYYYSLYSRSNEFLIKYYSCFIIITIIRSNVKKIRLNFYDQNLRK